MNIVDQTRGDEPTPSLRQTQDGSRTLDLVEIATAEWVDWFNHRRLFEYCGDIPPPADLETAYYAYHRAQLTAELSHQ